MRKNYRRGFFVAVGTFWAAALAVMLSLSPAPAQKPMAAEVCPLQVYKHIVSATDTQAVAATAGQNIYVCDYAFSFAGTATFYLESSTSGTCGATLTQISALWNGVANLAKFAYTPFFTPSMPTGVGNQLCIHSTGTGGFDITIYYAKF